MRLPRKWALSMGLLAAAPSLVAAGPFDRKAEPAAEKRQSGSNQQIADDVKAALQAARPKGKGIQIEVRNGVATVSGSISDAAEKARVTQCVSRVPGVEEVDNRLKLMTAAPASGNGIEQAGYTGDRRGPIQQVGAASPSETPFRSASAEAPAAPPASYGPAPASYAAPAPAAGSNQEMAQGIADALASCGLSDYDIEIRYKQGTCSLVGAVEAREQAIAADRAARSVPGVQNVLNRLTVNGQLAIPAPQRGPIAPTAGMQGQGYPQQGYPQGYPQGMGPRGPQGMPQGMGPQGMMQAQAQGMAPPQPMMGPGGAPAMGPGGVQPVGHHMIYNQPNVPEYAWPSYAAPDNYAAVTYPSQYDASAWPYMGPFYPYPQVPLNWRQATLEWDDGYWSLRFSPRTDKWWWFMSPHNWH